MRCLTARTMIQGLYNSASAADSLQAWGDVIARNIGAMGMPGFRKEMVAFEGVPFGTAMVGANPARPVEHAMTTPVGRTAVSLQPGDMRRTGDAQEFAIDGPGFFRFQRPDGEFVFSRDGQLRISPEGQLISKQGYVLMGEAGPVQLLIDGGPFSIDVDGRVMQGDQEVGEISVYDFADATTLRRANGGFTVDPDRPQVARVAEDSRVFQGFIEESNVSPMREMADLVLITTALQANQKVIQTIDGVLERTVQQLGNPL
jgi:flagellar basal-body rod protein FlgF